MVSIQYYILLVTILTLSAMGLSMYHNCPHPKKAAHTIQKVFLGATILSAFAIVMLIAMDTGMLGRARDAARTR